MRQISILIFLVSLGAVFSEECPSFNGDINPDIKTKLFKGQQIFTINFLKELLNEQPDSNIFFSPYSLYRALLLAYMGGKNHTEKALHDVLNLSWSNDKDEVVRAYKSEKMRRLQNAAEEKNLQFESADKFYFSDDVKINECVAKTFSDEIEILDFKDSAKAVQHINNWVEQVTRDQIKDLLTPDAIDSGSKLLIANAAYFKGLWQSKFDEEETTMENFHVRADKIRVVPMMKQVGRFSVSANEELGCYVLEMPYNQTSEGKGTSFVVFLPPQSKKIDEVLEKINPQSLSQALNDGHMQQVDLKFPKMTLEQELKLVPIFSKMGLGSVFNDDADFSGFSETSKIQFNDAIHKAKIEIDEAGSKAAAATSLFMFRSSRPLEPLELNCNHPFLFMIYDHKTRAILFAGVYREPEQTIKV